MVGHSMVSSDRDGNPDTPLGSTTTHETPAQLERTLFRKQSRHDSDTIFEAEDLPNSDQETFDGSRISEIKGRKGMVYKSEWFKTVLAMLSFFLATNLNHLALAIVMDIVSRNPLPDISHSMFKQSHVTRQMTDQATLYGSLGTTFFVLLFHKHRSIVLRRMFTIGTILFIMRAITISVTHIPPSYEDSETICEDPSQDVTFPIKRYFERSLNIFTTFGLQTSEIKLYCGDMLFSGHTTTAAISCFILNHYTPKALWPFRIAMITICVCAMVGAVLSRAHYTADVVLGYWISSLVFSFYHSFTYVKHRKRALCRPFRRALIFWIMFEMEKNVPYGRIPNDLDWPLPWPKYLKDGFRAWNLKTRTSRAGRISRFLAKYRLKLHF
ncbi:hypothetical protein PRIPAC_84220 [Pristionchus pacificus]|uniref:PAP2_C domain-containing protein n=1 Tax=Pristionchus pacificus TaxID=54126 RepID=A0A2A6BT48_PRIPA|nr:hypothetical protein PRIPAC_84220 [Pristionchus pacificus]|eukprot:PDM68986.1 hypothetical protein PRIPAC_47288 [Pristionchus pacificus]